MRRAQMVGQRSKWSQALAKAKRWTRLWLNSLEDRTVPTTMYAVDTANGFLSFDSATPGTISPITPISGLQPGEVIRGIDVRPANGQVYGLGITDDGATRTGRLYTINPATAAATQVGATPFSTSLSDTSSWGFDFNPVVDRIRVVNSLGQNLRLNPNNGALAGTDTNLTITGIDGGAYDRNFHGATVTTLYAYNFQTDQLSTIGGINGSPSPNGGTVTDIGPSGFVSLGAQQFDIDSSSGVARLATETSSSGGNTNLYTMNLTTGAATLVGTIGTGPLELQGLTTAIPQGTRMYAITQANELITFGSADPTNIFNNVPITGLQPSEFIHGIDTRPATQQLYGLGIVDDGATRTGRIYTIDPITGVATQVGGAPWSTSLQDTGVWGMDFNPNVDLIRITNDKDGNFRVSPNTGALVGTDTNLNPSGQRIEDNAYTNSAGFVAATTLYGLSFANDSLVTIGGVNGAPSPNTGQIFNVGSLGVVNLGDYGFDIEAGTNIGRITVRPTAPFQTQMFTVDLTTGATTLVGTIGNGTLLLRGLTSAQNAITVGGTGGNDTLTVTATGPNSGSYVLNGNPPVAFANVSSFSFIGGAGSDTFTLNNPAGGLFGPTDGIFFHGGGNPNDEFRNLGGTANSGSYTNGVATGTGTLANVLGSINQFVTITGATGIIDTTTAPILTVNGSIGADTFSLSPNVVAFGTQLSQVNLATPANSPAILYGNRTDTTLSGSDGNDLFILAGTSNKTNIVGGNDNDRLQFGNAMSLATLSGGTFDGGSGVDLIDYASTPTGVRVNLGLTNNMTVDLDGTQENPAANTMATGTGTVTYDASTRQVTVSLTISNLFNPILDSHIHFAPLGVNGPVIVPFGPGIFVPAGPGNYTANASATLPEINEAALLGGSTYFNVHTNIFPGGEIRGQIMPGANFNLAAGFASGTGGIVSVENVTGGNAADSIVGNNQANILSGGSGNDIIVGGPGADTMAGGNDNDTMVWNPGDGSDVMDGNDGFDFVHVNGGNGSENFTLANNASRGLFIRTTAATFNLDIGTDESLRLQANGGNDTFTASGLTTAGSGITNLQLFGQLGDDSFNLTNCDLSNGVQVNGNLGTNSLTMLNSNLNNATKAGQGVSGDGVFGQFLATVNLTTVGASGNAGDGVRFEKVGDVSILNGDFNLNVGDGVRVNGGGKVTIDDGGLGLDAFDNGGWGVRLQKVGDVVLRSGFGEDNTAGGILVDEAKNVTVDFWCLNDNDGDGLRVSKVGDVLFDQTFTNGNKGSGFVASKAGNITIRNSGLGTELNSNIGDGLRFLEVGDVNLESLVVTGNGADGVNIAKAGKVGVNGINPGKVTINDNIIFGVPLTYQAQLNTAMPGSGYDQLISPGPINLGGAALDLVVDAAFPFGTEFVLIDNTGVDPIGGTFAGLPEGQVFKAGGQDFIISYKGGATKNDVTVTRLGPPNLTAQMIGGNLYLTGLNTPNLIKIAGQAGAVTVTSNFNVIGTFPVTGNITLNCGTADDTVTICANSGATLPGTVTVFGSGGNDTVIVQSTAATPGKINNLTLQLGEGNNTVVDQGVAINGNWFIGAGAGNDVVGPLTSPVGSILQMTMGNGANTATVTSKIGSQLRYYGGSGTDNLTVGGTNSYYLAALMGAGDDTFTFQPGTTIGYGLIDLGLGTDTYLPNGVMTNKGALNVIGL